MLKPLDQFSFRDKLRGFRHKSCKKCHSDYNRRKFFDLTPSQYDVLVAQQNNRCAICKQPETVKRNGKVKALAVDHDHVTGAIRQLLCSSCNQGLGRFKDNPELLEQAAAYLRRHSALSA
jgi:hypothetical protein